MEPPLNNMTEEKCTALYRKLCVPSPVGHMRMQMYNIDIGRRPDWNTSLGTATFTANTIEFLLTRGAYALLGYSWDGCFSAPTPRAKDDGRGRARGRPRRPVVLRDDRRLRCVCQCHVGLPRAEWGDIAQDG